MQFWEIKNVHTHWQMLLFLVFIQERFLLEELAFVLLEININERIRVNTEINLLIGQQEVSLGMLKRPWALDHSIVEVLAYCHRARLHELGKDVLDDAHMTAQRVLSNDV